MKAAMKRSFDASDSLKTNLMSQGQCARTYSAPQPSTQRCVADQRSTLLISFATCKYLQYFILFVSAISGCATNPNLFHHNHEELNEVEATTKGCVFADQPDAIEKRDSSLCADEKSH